jgi:high-affinity nickel-transport protein
MMPADLGPLAILGLGLALGVRHAADADHVVAVAALASTSRRPAAAAWLGVVWGMGHSITLLAAGAAIIVLGWVVPPRVGLAMELVVALALMVLGVLNLGAGVDRGVPRVGAGPPPPGRAFVVGLAHGLAGSAAVALLVLASVRDAGLAMLWLLVFALGTVAGMVLVTTGIALPLGALRGRWASSERAVRLATGTLSLGFGIWMAVQIGWHDGLFAAVPRGSPH